MSPDIFAPDYLTYVRAIYLTYQEPGTWYVYTDIYVLFICRFVRHTYGGQGPKAIGQPCTPAPPLRLFLLVV